MTKLRTIVGLAAVAALQVGVAASPSQAADTCSNAAFRVGPSVKLPDCRAYELVSPDSNHAAGGGQPGGWSSADGNTFAYQTIDTTSNAQSASVFNVTRATRDPAKGWSGRALEPPRILGPSVYAGSFTINFSDDLSSTIDFSDQPLEPGRTTTGQNMFVGRADGTYHQLTDIGAPLSPFFPGYTTPSPTDISWGNSDYSHIYFPTVVPQVLADPTPGNNLYSWSQATGLRLVGILPNGTAAPNGASMPATGVPQPASSDGRYVTFVADGRLYVRIDDTSTVDLTAFTLDPGNLFATDQAGVTATGSKVLFTSHEELTGNSNTGTAAGQPLAGRDLYSYDPGTGQVTDLTPHVAASDPKGADVIRVYGVTKDGSYVYFTASGQLAPGATSGQPALYVWHNGTISFVADSDIEQAAALGLNSTYITPDGQHFSFMSKLPLTGYDNTDPVTGAPHFEVFTYAIGSTVRCASCRQDGTRPTADSGLPGRGGLGGAANSSFRMMSNDGRRTFFESRDAVIPEASNGFQQVFQYEDGRVSAISPLDGSFDSAFLSTSASGDDVFINSYDALVPNPNNGDYAVYDARVNGGRAIPDTSRCATPACPPAATPAPVLPSAASVTFLGNGNADDDDDTAVPSKVTVSKIKTITGTSGTIKVKIPGRGKLTVTGSGLRSVRSSPSKAQTITVRLALTAKAVKSLRKHRSYKTKARVGFTDSGGRASSVTLSVSFKLQTSKKGD